MVQKSVAINQQAMHLGGIARNLASKNYKDFPTIADNIHKASNEVDQATLTMQNAMNQLATIDDRVEGWNGLLDACRVMSGKTIYLLQVIYGADVHRLLQACDRLKDHIRLVRPKEISHLPEDQIRFRDTGKVAATYTNQVSVFLQQHTPNVESGFAKTQIEEWAKTMASEAQKFIGLINAGLQDPGNKDKAVSCDAYTITLIAEVDKLKQFIKDISPEVPTADLDDGRASRRLRGLGDEDDESASDRLFDPNQYPAMFAPINRSACDLTALEGAPIEVDSSPYDILITDAKRALDFGKYGAQAGEAIDFISNVKAAQEMIAELQSALDDDQGIPERRANNDRLKALLQKAFPEYVKAGKALVQDPSNIALFRNLEDANENLKNVLDEVNEALRIPSLEEILRQLRSKGDLLADLAAKKEREERFRQQLMDMARGLKNLGLIIKKEGEGIAKKEPEEKKRRVIYETLEDLLLGVQHLQLTVENKTDNPQEIARANAKMQQSVDRFEDSIRRNQASDALRNLRKAHEEMLHAARRGDKEGFDFAADKLKQAKADCVDKIRKFAEEDDPHDVNKLNNRNRIANMLDTMIDNEIILATDLVGDPRNARKIRALKNAEEETTQCLSEATDLLGPIRGGDKHSLLTPTAEGLKKAIRDIQAAAYDDPVPKILAAKQPLVDFKAQTQKVIDDSDANKKDLMQPLLDEMDRAFRQQVETVKKCNQNPTDVQLMSQLETDTYAVINLIDNLVLLSENSLEENLDEILRIAALLPVTHKQNRGDRKVLLPHVLDLKALYDRVKDQVETIIGASYSATQKDDLRHLLRDLDVAIRDTERDVLNNAGFDAIDRDAEEIRRAVLRLKKDAHVATRRNIDAIRRCLDNFLDATVNNNPRWNQIANVLSKNAQELADAASRDAKNIQDPNQRQRALRAAEEVAENVEAVRLAAAEVMKDPSNPHTKRALQDCVDRLQKSLRDLQDAFRNKTRDMDDGNVEQFTFYDMSVSDYIRAVERAKEKLEEIRRAAESGNHATIIPNTNKVKKAMEDMSAMAQKFVDDPNNDARRRQDVVDIVNAFDDVLRPFIDSVKNHLQNPKEVKTKQALLDCASHVDKVLDDFAEATRKNNLNENLNLMKNLLDQLNKAKQNGNQSEVERLAAQLADVNAVAQEQVSAQADRMGHPKKKRQLKNDQEELKDLMAEIMHNATNPRNPHSSAKAMAEAIDAAQKKIADIQGLANTGAMSDLDHAERALREMVHAGERGDAAGYKKGMDKVRARVKDLLDSSDAVSKNPQTDPGRAARIQKAIDDVRAATKRLEEEHAKSPDAMSVEARKAADALAEALARLGRVLLDQDGSVNLDGPEEEYETITITHPDWHNYQRINKPNAWQNLVAAVEQNNRPKFQSAINQIKKEFQDYKSAQMKAAPHDEERRRALDELEKVLLPSLEAKGNEACRSNDLAQKVEFHAEAKKFQRAMDRLQRKDRHNQDEAIVVRDVAALIRERVRKAREDRLRGRRESGSYGEILPDNEFNQVRRNLAHAVDRRNQYQPANNNLAGVDSELEALWKKHGLKRGEAGKGNSDAKLVDNELDKIEDDLLNKMDSVVQRTKADRIAAIKDVEIALDNVMGVGDVGDADRVKSSLQDLNNKVKIARGMGPELANMDDEVKAVIFSLQDLAKDNFDDTDKLQVLKEDVEKARLPLLQAISSIDPDSKDRQVVVGLQKTKIALGDVDAAVRKGDLKDVAVAITNAQNLAHASAKATQDLAASTPDEDSRKKHRDQLLLAANELERAADNIVPPSAADQLNFVRWTTGRTDDAVEFTLGVIRGDVDNAPLPAPIPREVVPSSQAPKSTPVATTVAPTPKPTAVVQPAPVVNTNDAAIKPKPAVKPAEVKTTVKKATDTFEDTAEKVAEDIATIATQVQSSTATDISFHLNNLAKHARSGERKEMLMEAKKASEKLNELCKQLRDTASKIQGKTQQEKIIQDRLLRAAQALQNYGVQLKILTSVKASSLTTDKDNDMTLSSIVLGIGTQISEGLTSLDITDRTILRRK